MQESLHRRLKLAELTSSVGAGILGFAVGSLASGWLAGIVPVVLALGLGLHLWGMVDKHRLERAAPQAWWTTAAYWLCWVGLVVLAVVVLARALQ